MDAAQLPDLDGLDREALKALLIAHQEELRTLAALADSRQDELRSLEAELDSHRQTLSQQDDQLRSSSEQIEHLKLVIEKLRRRVFGVKSEKIIIQLEQLELHLEELESSQAEAEAAVERVRPAAEPKTRSRRKPLPEHLPREVVSHAFHGDSCPDCGGQLRQFGEDVSEQLEYIPDSFKFATCGRSLPAVVVSAWSKRLRHRVRSSADLPDRHCWPTCWFRNSQITCPSIASRRSTLARELRLSVPRWPTG
jgi:DNA repair exonuclease SbcCD ATPase subunit